MPLVGRGSAAILLDLQSKHPTAFQIADSRLEIARAGRGKLQAPNHKSQTAKPRDELRGVSVRLQVEHCPADFLQHFRLAAAALPPSPAGGEVENLGLDHCRRAFHNESQISVKAAASPRRRGIAIAVFGLAG
jgi:hypothetical protein